MKSVARCLTFYSVGEAVRYRQDRSLREAWNTTLTERIPDDLRELVERLR